MTAHLNAESQEPVPEQRGEAPQGHSPRAAEHGGERPEGRSPGMPRAQEHGGERPGRRSPGMPWARWGEPLPLPPQARELLSGLLGADLRPRPSVAQDEVVLPPARL